MVPPRPLCYQYAGAQHTNMFLCCSTNGCAIEHIRNMKMQELEHWNPYILKNTLPLFFVYD